MKKILLFILLFFAGITQAQYQTDSWKVKNSRLNPYNNLGINLPSGYDYAIGDKIILTFKNTSSIFSGELAGANSAATYTVGVGLNAARYCAGNYSTAMGNEALEVSTKVGCSGFGSYSGRNNTGENAGAFGYGSLYYNTGDNSNAFGFYAGAYNQSNGLSAFGHYSATYQTGIKVSAYGYAAGEFNAGDYGTFVGDLAGMYQSGLESNFFGANSGRYNRGARATGFGSDALIYNEGDFNTAIGSASFANFIEDTTNEKSFDYTNINVTGLDTITIANHGFGSSGKRINLKYKQGTSAITGLTDNNIYVWMILDSNRLVGGDLLSNTIKYDHDITAVGTGTGHKFIPQIRLTMSTAIGRYAEPTKSHQVMLGDSSLTEVYTHGAYVAEKGGTFGDTVRVTGAVIINDTTVTVPDYVFESTYKQNSISEMRDFFTLNKHLPTMPSEAEIKEKKEINVMEYSMKLLETIEVQAKYISELEERISAIEKKLK